MYPTGAEITNTAKVLGMFSKVMTSTEKFKFPLTELSRQNWKFSQLETISLLICSWNSLGFLIPMPFFARTKICIMRNQTKVLHYYIHIQYVSIISFSNSFQWHRNVINNNYGSLVGLLGISRNHATYLDTDLNLRYGKWGIYPGFQLSWPEYGHIKGVLGPIALHTSRNSYA